MKKFLITLGVILSFSVQAKISKAYFAGGCFWCVEADFEKLEGVEKAISGFTGGELKNPTYNGNHQGHYETVEVYYNSEKVSYDQLLKYFWKHIDPFDPNGQFCDKGFSYRSAIFYANDKEKKQAEESKDWVIKKFPKQTVATEILPLKTFYPIKGEEEYHQDYYKKNSIRYNFYRFNCGRDKRVKEIWGTD